MIPKLEETLAPLGVKMVDANDRVIKMRRVPTGSGFSKPQTGLILIRHGDGQPYLAMLVDKDLQYHGPDATRVNLFGLASCRKNWRVLPLPGSVANPIAAVRKALKLLGNDMVSEQPEEPSLLARHAVSPLAIHPFAVHGWEQELLRASSYLTTESAGCVLIVGEDGVGKSAFVSALARGLSSRGWEFATVSLPSLFAGASDAGKEDLLAHLLADAARSRLVLVLDQLQWLGALPLSSALLQGAAGSRAPLVGTLPPAYLPWFKANIRRAGVIVLRDLDPNSSLPAVEERRVHLASYHGIRVSDECGRIALERCLPMAGHLPGKAIELLDLACARAVLEGASMVEEIHILLAASDLEESSTAAAGAQTAVQLN